jgi:hypothetical protein
VWYETIKKLVCNEIETLFRFRTTRFFFSVHKIEIFILIRAINHSDEWRAYKSLRNDPNDIHLTINHSVGFVQLTTGVHTQNIENNWMQVKRKEKKQEELCRILLPTYSGSQNYPTRFVFGLFPSLKTQIRTQIVISIEKFIPNSNLGRLNQVLVSQEWGFKKTKTLVFQVPEFVN